MNRLSEWAEKSERIEKREGIHQVDMLPFLNDSTVAYFRPPDSVLNVKMPPEEKSIDRQVEIILSLFFLNIEGKASGERERERRSPLRGVPKVVPEVHKDCQKRLTKLAKLLLYLNGRSV